MTLEAERPRALVIGATGGIGRALGRRIAQERGEGNLFELSRGRDALDIVDEKSVSAAAQRFQDDGVMFDLIIQATGILEVDGQRPEKSFSELTPEAMLQSFAVNALGVAMVFKHFRSLLVKGERSVFATLSARVGSIGDNRLGGWMSYRASKAALNQIVKCAAIETRRTHPHAIVAALHPGTIETELTRAYARGRYTATPEQVAEQLLDVVARLREDQTGAFFDYAGDSIPW